MSSLSIEEKKGLEEVFRVLSERKNRRLKVVKNSLVLYRQMKIFSIRKLLLLRNRE